jgi:tetratricopeptide (TPR) repeat protein
MTHGTDRLALLLVAAVLTGCSSGLTTGQQDSAQDELARNQYYQEAAKTYFDGGKYRQAVAMWDKVLATRPDDQWAKFGLGKSLQMLGTLQSLRRAQNVLEGIVNLDWTHPQRGDVRFEVQTALATVYSDLSDFYDRDVRALEKRLKDDASADAPVVEEQLTRQQQVRDDLLNRSVPLWNAVLAGSPDNPYALAGLAKANLVSGDEAAGIAYAERYVALTRQSQEGWKQSLAAWTKKMKGDVKPEVVQRYREKIRGAREKEMGMLLLLGSVHMRREEFQKAVDQYDEILDRDPARVAALVERAQAYAGLGLYQRAVVDLEEYLKLTDARTQREERISAADLLDRYRRITSMRPVQPTRGTVPSGPAAAPGVAR